jgi:O-methyltransferase domain/Dimerisation domain
VSADELPTRDVFWRMANAYQASQAIHVAATLGIADLLEAGPMSTEELAQSTHTHAPSLYRLLRALSSVGVFAEGADGRFGLTPLAEHLRTDAPGSLRAWAMFIGRPYTWSAWAHLLDSVKTGEAAFPKLHGTSAWEYWESRPEEGAIFAAAMTGLSTLAAEAIVGSYDFSDISVLADVGGGHGSLLAAILKANPALHGILFDLPHVVANARELLEREGVSERCEVVGGSFFEAVPTGADAYMLKSVLLDWDDATAIRILGTCRAAMPKSGRLLLVERLVGPPNEPDLAKFSDLNMLVLQGGRERTTEEFAKLCAAAGFRLAGVTETGSPYDIIEGTPI